MEKRNEPTTEEIVEKLTNKNSLSLSDIIDLQQAEIAELTARAERAEKERDAAVAEKERILNLRASENTDNKYLYML